MEKLTDLVGTDVIAIIYNFNNFKPVFNNVLRALKIKNPETEDLYLTAGYRVYKGIEYLNSADRDKEIKDFSYKDSNFTYLNNPVLDKPETYIYYYYNKELGIFRNKLGALNGNGELERELRYYKKPLF